MPNTYFTITFTSVLYSHANKAIKNLTTNVEYFSTYENRWVALTQGTTNGLGILKATFDLPARISAVDDKTQAIKDIISSGSIPTFRLALPAEDDKQDVFILSNTYAIKVDNESLLIDINFGKKWMLPDGKSVKINNTEYLITSNSYGINEDLNDCLKAKEQLTAELETLRNIVEEMTAVNERVLSERNEFEKKYNEANTGLTNCRFKFENLSAELGFLQGKNIELQNGIDTLTENLKASEDKNGILLEEKTELEQRIESLMQDLKKCQDNGALWEKEKLELEKTIIDLKQKLKDCRSEGGNWEEERNELEETIEGLTEELKTCQIKGSLLEEEKFELGKSITTLTQDLQACQDEGGVLAEEKLGLENTIINLTEKLKTCQNKGGVLEEEKIKLEGTIANLQEELKACQSNGGDRDAEIIELKTTIAILTQELKACQDRGSLLKEEHLELENTIANLTQKLKECRSKSGDWEIVRGELESTIATLTKELQACQDRSGILEKEKTELETTITILNQNLNNCHDQRDRLEGEKTELAKTVEILNQNLTDCKTKTSRLEEEKATVESKLKEAVAHQTDENPNKISARAVYTGIANELKEAQTALEGTNFRLGNVKLSLKALVNKSPTGISYELLDKEVAKELPENAISTVEMDVIMDEPIAANNSSQLPNLVGYTETVVRKRLNAMGLKLKPVYSKGVPNVALGQSYKQQPDIDTAISTGQVVTVFFAKG